MGAFSLPLFLPFFFYMKNELDEKKRKEKRQKEKCSRKIRSDPK